jgi:hypothetical protein
MKFLSQNSGATFYVESFSQIGFEQEPLTTLSLKTVMLADQCLYP